MLEEHNNARSYDHIFMSTLRNRCRHRPVQYLNNILEQDHRAIKRRVNAKQDFRQFPAARRTIQGYEAIHMIRKGQARWVAGDDLLRQIQFIDSLFAFGSLRTHDRRSATNLSALKLGNTTLQHVRSHSSTAVDANLCSSQLSRSRVESSRVVCGGARRMPG